MINLPEHGRFSYSALPDRPDYSWPGGKRLALYFGINVEHFAYGRGLVHAVSRTGPAPDSRTSAWLDYGNRVGFWRLLEIFDSLELPACHLVNATIPAYAPRIVEAIKQRGDEVIGHARSNSERQGEMWEEDEARLIAQCRDTLKDSFGVAPRGWMSPWMSQSVITPDLLHEAGFEFLMDWPFDDQPAWMNTRNGRLLSVPYSLEVNDSTQIIARQNTGRDFSESLIDHFEELVESSERYPLVCGIGLHTTMVAQPHRLRSFRKAMEHIVNHPLFDRVWVARPGEIFDHYNSLPQDVTI
jgi:peptidoglycan/xylan/chitin deacetylase (PgdA/CDA1 family)